MGSENSVAGGQPAKTRSALPFRRTREHVAIPQPRRVEPDPGFTIITPSQSRLKLLWPVIGLALVCVGINLAGRITVMVFNLQVHLDMIGTAVAAIALGPWAGAAVGLTSSAIGAVIGTSLSLVFAVVNIAGALVWGYGVRHFKMGRSLRTYLNLNLIVAATCTAIAVPILLMLQGNGGHTTDDLMTSVLFIKDYEFIRITLSNLFTSVFDKLIAGFVALAVLAQVSHRIRGKFDLPLIDTVEDDER